MHRLAILSLIHGVPDCLFVDGKVVVVVLRKPDHSVSSLYHIGNQSRLQSEFQKRQSFLGVYFTSLLEISRKRLDLLGQMAHNTLELFLILDAQSQTKHNFESVFGVKY